MLSEAQFTIRSASSEDARGIARVHVDAWRRTYHVILPSEFLEGLSNERREQYWRQVLAELAGDRGLHVLDQIGAGIKGFVSVGPERDQIHGYMVSSMQSTC